MTLTRRHRLAIVLTGLAALLILALWLGPKLNRRYYHHGLKLVEVARDLEIPWSFAFLPEGGLLVAERPGRLRIVDAQGRAGPPLAGLPPVAAVGEGGLLGVALAPDFARSRQLYWSYSEADPGGGPGYGTAVARGVLGAGRLENVQVIFRQGSRATDLRHFGGRLLFDAQGRLLVGLGDRMLRADAQAPASLHGKIVRLMPDGQVPPDNPWVGRADVAPAVWSLGHRNVQGLAWHPTTGSLWASEHGPSGGDEINLIRPGVNYGWPVITHGCEYDTCAPIGEGRAKPGLEQPLTWFGPQSVPPSGMAFVTSDRYPGWRGQLFVGVLSGPGLVRLAVDGDRVVAREPLWLGRHHRVRDVQQGPDGWLYVAVESPRGAIVRLEPRTFGPWRLPAIPGGPGL